MNRSIVFTLAAALALSLVACSEEEEKDACHLAAVTMTVTYGAQSADVDLADLDGVLDGDLCRVPLVDVVTTANLGIDLASTYVTFEAADGFRPTQVGCSELPGTTLDDGDADRPTGAILWDEALGLRGCYSVNQARVIIVTDATTI
jgi:hypothetical protein